MAALIEEGNIYIAQPPLYRIKRKSVEEYIHTEKEMDQMILDLGTKAATFILKEKASAKTFTQKEFKDVVNKLIELERLLVSLEKKGVPAGKYLENADYKKNKFPSYKLRVGNKIIFVFSDEELMRYGEIDELDTVELFESHDIKDVNNYLKKYKLSVQDYLSGDKSKFSLRNDELKKETKFKCLREIFAGVKKETTHGMTLQRYKGLGEMNPQQLWESTMDPKTRTIIQVTLEDAVEADRIFTILMGESAQTRREFIQSYAHEVKNLDI